MIVPADVESFLKMLVFRFLLFFELTFNEVM